MGQNARVRACAGLADQPIGGGFSGGEEKESDAKGNSTYCGTCGVTMRAMEIAGAATAASMQDTRQSVMELAPSGQQGQGLSPSIASCMGMPSQGISVAPAVATDAAEIAGTTSSNWAAMSRNIRGFAGRRTGRP